MPDGQIRAFPSKQCPFWVNFGYVVPEIKYAPKLVELISNNDYGLSFMKSGGALAAKIIDIERQQPQGHAAVSPRYVRSKVCSINFSNPTCQAGSVLSKSIQL